MPVIVALAARALIQAAISLGILTLIENIALPLINKAIIAIMEAFGVSEQDAQDIMANEVVKFAEEAGVLAATLRTKIPTKIAERLGFTTKGFAKRALSSTTAAKVSGTAASNIIINSSGATRAAEVAATVAKTRGFSLDSVQKVAQFVIAGVGVPVGVGLLITNTVDFAAWPSSAYQGTFQRLLSFFGVEADKEKVTAKVISEDMFSKVYNIYLNDGVTAIKDPYTNTQIAYTRANLAALVDKLAASIMVEQGKITIKQLLGALTALMVYGTAAPSVVKTAQASAAAPAPSTPTIKVFTGVISQGTLGDTTPFAARENDLIDTTEELQQAFQNNLAMFLQALPGRLSYELKIVSSVVDKDGTRRSPTTQQLITGYNKDGTPKYKKVTNKFAELDIYVVSSRGTRSKIQTVILGPTDAVKLNPTGAVLSTIASNVKQSITTSNIADISKIQTSAPVSIQPVTQLQPTPTILTQTVAPAAPMPMSIEATKQAWTDQIASATWSPTTDRFGNMILPSKAVYDAWSDQDKTTYRNMILGLYNRAKTANEWVAAGKQAILLGTDSAFVGYTLPDNPLINSIIGKPLPQAQNAAPATPTTAVASLPAELVPVALSNNAQRCTATSIAEFYDINRELFPSVAERAKLYEAFGLGPAAWYTGTAEQNAKLLVALKAHAGCSVKF